MLLLHSSKALSLSYRLKLEWDISLAICSSTVAYFLESPNTALKAPSPTVRLEVAVWIPVMSRFLA